MQYHQHCQLYKINISLKNKILVQRIQTEATLTLDFKSNLVNYYKNSFNSCLYAKGEME